jgi:hypothetical protein
MMATDPRTRPALALAAVLAAAPLLSAEEDAPRPFLRTVIRLDDSQLAAVERGEVVTKLLETPEKGEIAAFGVAKTAGTPDLLLRLARDIQTFRKVPQIPEMGIFSAPPKLEDLRGLTHPPADLAALKSCKVGSCDVKLGSKGLGMISKINWSAPDAEKQAAAIFNQAIVDFVTAYQQGGVDALGDVQDKKTAKQRAQEHRTLLSNSPYLATYVKEFNDYLAAYPKGKLAGAEDIHYWAKDTFGLKPVIAVYHLTLLKSDRGVLVSNRQVAASHFFNAALEILAGVPAADGQGMYLLSLYRTRLDPPTGMLAGVLMGKVRGGIETGVAENLKFARQRLAAVK